MPEIVTGIFDTFFQWFASAIKAIVTIGLFGPFWFLSAFLAKVGMLSNAL